MSSAVWITISYKYDFFSLDIVLHIPDIGTGARGKSVGKASANFGVTAEKNRPKIEVHETGSRLKYNERKLPKPYENAESYFHK